MDETRLPLTEHLAELRKRIARVLLAWVLGFGVAYRWKQEIYGWVVAPARAALPEIDRTLQGISPPEIFFTYVKCALLAGFVASLPVIFWQVWAFVAPGLYPSEKFAIGPFALISTALFVGGAFFGYSQVFPIIFDFFTSFDSELVQSAWTMREVFSISTRLLLAFGVAFELPILVFFLSVTGIVDARTLWRGTPYAVLIVFVTAALLTPPDVVSQIFLGVPMVGLYLLGVGVAYLFGGRKEAEGASQESPSG